MSNGTNLLENMSDIITFISSSLLLKVRTIYNSYQRISQFAIYPTATSH